MVCDRKSLLEAVTAPDEAFGRALRSLWLTATVLRKGEVAIIAHYDVMPGVNPWELPEIKDDGWIYVAPDGEFAIGKKERLLRYVTVPAIHVDDDDMALDLIDPTDIYVHHNTPELRAQLGITPSTWYIDKPEPVAVAMQFAPQFAPRTRRV